MVTKIAKIKVSAHDVMETHQAMSNAAAADRFSNAQAITQQHPTGLSGQGISPGPSVSLPSVARQAITSPIDLLNVQIGAIIRVPLHLIDTNPYSPRQIYLNEDIDRIASTIGHGQDDAAHGYIQDGRVKLIDGGTRFRAAKVTDLGFLDVKVEDAPGNPLDLFNRARDLNEQRSDSSSLDFALALKKLLNDGCIGSQKEIVEKVMGPKKTLMTEGTVSQYMRIARMPEKVQKRMIEFPETSTMGALYAVSCLFSEDSADTEQSTVELALDICDEIKRRKLNKEQIVALVKSRQAGPKQRDRSVAVPIAVFGHKGQFKTFARKGKLELSLSGLSESEIELATNALMNAISSLGQKS